jgi:ABC-type transporter MlaC component
MSDEPIATGSICRFVLGPYWCGRESTRAQVRFYGRQLAQCGDGDFVVTGSRSGPGASSSPARSSVRRLLRFAVDWRLRISHGVYKIKDVAINGLRMALAHRAEIRELIARGEGQLGILLATMRQAG